VRQSQTVDGLLQAAMEELRAVGYAELTVRNVARRAGVAPATAYNYFASKEHLVTEVYWRRFVTQPELPPVNGTSADVADRVIAALSAFALVVADEAELSAACTVAVLAEDPDVKVLRERIAAEFRRRLADAFGHEVDAAVMRTLHFATAGLLLQVGTGHLDYEAIPRLLDEVVRTVLAGTEQP